MTKFSNVTSSFSQLGIVIFYLTIASKSLFFQTNESNNVSVSGIANGICSMYTNASLCVLAGMTYLSLN